MKQIAFAKVERLTTMIQNLHQIALVTEEAALTMSRTDDGGWYLTKEQGHRLVTFCIMLTEHADELERRVEDMPST